MQDNGLHFWHGAQLAVDATLVSPLTRDGSPQPAADVQPGADWEFRSPARHSASGGTRIRSCSVPAAAALSSSALKQPKGPAAEPPRAARGLAGMGRGSAGTWWSTSGLGGSIGVWAAAEIREIARLPLASGSAPEGPIRCGELSEVDERSGAHRFAAISFRRKSFFAKPRTAICSRHAGAVLHGQHSNNTWRCKAAFHKNNVRFALLSLVFG